MMKFLWPALLTCLSCGAAAQAAANDDDSSDGPPRGWQLGVATVVSDSVYAGEGSRVIPIPLIAYQGERFYFRGISAGWSLFGMESFEVAALAKLRFDGFSVDDLGREELAANGLDYRLLEDRDKAVDVGLGLKWRGAAGEIELELLADATDKSGGQEVSLQYGYPMELGAGTLTPSVGISWLSKDMANYYYGTLDKEVARGVVDYKPGSVVVPQMGISYFRPLGEKWTLMSHLKYSRLPDEITDSPFVEPDTNGTASVFIGFSRAF